MSVRPAPSMLWRSAGTVPAPSMPARIRSTGFAECLSPLTSFSPLISEKQEASVSVMKRRLQPILDAGAVEGDPDYWYGVVEGHAGALWAQLFVSQVAAAKCAKNLDGHVVIVAARILEDAEGE